MEFVAKQLDQHHHQHDYTIATRSVLVNTGVSLCVISESVWTELGDMHQAWQDVTNFLSTVGQQGVVLSSKKFHFAERKAEFMGFQLSNGTSRCWRTT